MASLQEQVDAYVDVLLAQGVMSWKCDFFGAFHAETESEPRRIEWVCTVCEGIMRRREVP